MYKIIIAFLITFLSANFINAQYEYENSFIWQSRSINDKPIYYVPCRNVQQIDFNVKNQRNGKIKSYIKRYNYKGKLTEYLFVNKQGNNVPIFKISYDSAGFRMCEELYKHGILKSAVNYKRTEKGKFLQSEKTNKKGRTIAKRTMDYNSDGCKTESVIFKRGGKKIKNKWVYTYASEKCKLSHSALYNGKGKLKYEWTYDCHDEGEQLEKKKNLTQVCTWEKKSDSLLIKCHQDFDEKGKKRKSVSKYLLPDTSLVEYNAFDDKNKLYIKVTYDKSPERPVCLVSYNKNGNCSYEKNNTYKNKLLVSETVSRNGKQKERSEYIYDDDNLLTERKSFRKGKLSSTITLKYIK